MGKLTYNVDYNDDDIQVVMDTMQTTKEKAEKYIQSVYKDLADDNVSIFDVLDVIQLEAGAPKSKVYVKADKPKAKPKKSPKVDDTKVKLVRELSILIEQFDIYGVSNINIENPQKEITFSIGTDEYSINLVKHRPKK